MDRLRWCSDDVEQYVTLSRHSEIDEESLITQQAGVRLYHGPDRSSFENGILKLTTHRLLWFHSSGYSQQFIALPLAAVVSIEAQSGGFAINRTPKLVVQLLPFNSLQNMLRGLPNIPQWAERWVGPDQENYQVLVCRKLENIIKLGFTQGGHHEFEVALNEVLQVKLWTVSSHFDSKSSKSFGVGIGAIERQRAARAAATDLSIMEAFDDLSQLMSKASEMVQLTKNLARKMRNTKDNSFTSNEVAELRSAMLSMGVSLTDESITKPITAANSGSYDFHTQLAHQLSELIYPLLNSHNDNRSQLTNKLSSIASAGCMDLASVYCHINRARGMDMISPADLLRACERLESQSLPLRLKYYPGGLLVLQLATENESQTLETTAKLVENCSSGLTAEEFARSSNLSPILAKGRLLAAEETGLICRDDSEAGLRFYANYFLKAMT